jgi:hypothetical protein
MSAATDYIQLTHAASEIDGTIDEVYAARGSYGNLSLKIASKQEELSQSQLAAVNSGITAEKLAADEAALVELVDNGAKNLLQLFQLGSSNANVGNPCTSQGVEYEIQSDGTITAYRKSSASSGAYIFLYKSGAIQNVSEFFDGKHIWSGNPPQYPDGGVSVWYKIGSGSNTTMPNGALLPNANGEDVQIGFQISTALSPTQSDPIVFKPMICTKAEWDVSHAYSPYALSNPVLTPALIEQVDNGAKNFSSVSSGIISNSGGGFPIQTTPITVPIGTYIISFRFSGNATRGSVQFRSGSMAINTLSFNMVPLVTVQIEISSDTIDNFNIYSNGTATISEFMICTAEDYAVSPKFVPYRPSWQEMWEMIQALQNGTRSAPALAKAEPEETEPETGEEEETR